MKRSRFWRKTVSMVLTCAMLGSTFAQCAVAEESFEPDTVIEIEEEVSAEEAVIGQTESAADAAETQEAAADAAETQETAADAAETQEAAADAAETQEAPVDDSAAENAEAGDDAQDETDTEASAAAPAGENDDADAQDVSVEETAEDESAAGSSETAEESELELLDDSGDILSITMEGVEPDLNVGTTPAEIEDNVGNGFKYTELEGNKIKITGLADDSAVPENLDLSVTIVNGKTVTEIGESAFADYTFTGRLKLPDTLESIGDSAFRNCGFSNELAIPASLETIGKRAFMGCGFDEWRPEPNSKLTSIGAHAFEGCAGFKGTLMIPSSVTTIDECAFSGCTGFTAVEIGTGLKDLENSVFEGCTGLKGTLAIPANVTEINDSVFKGCTGLTALNLPETLTLIGTSAFEGCTGLSGTLALPAGVKKINQNSFKGCTGLTALNLPAGLTEIGTSAFEGCTGLKAPLTIPASVATIGNSAFKGCTAIVGLYFVEESSALKTIGDSAFEGCTGLGGCNVNGEDDVSCDLYFPTGVTKIGANAFKGCGSIKGELRLNNLTSPTVGSGAFSGCGFDVALYMPADVTNVAADAAFTSISMKNTDDVLEVQAGTGFPEPEIYVGGSGLRLMSGYTWTVIDTASNQDVTAKNYFATSEYTMTASTAGEYTIRAGFKGYVTADQKVVVTAGQGQGQDSIPPAASRVRFDGTVMMPGTINFDMDVVEENMGIGTVSGFFCHKDNPEVQIPFTFDWTKAPKFTGTIGTGTEKLSVSIPSGTATGSYYLASMTMTDLAGNAVTYTYDPATNLWKNEKGNKIALTVESNLLVVKDGFGYNADGFEAYITNQVIEARLRELKNSDTTAVIRYDANNHTVPAAWFDAIRQGNIRLVLSDGLVEWSIWGKDIPESMPVRDFDCLGVVAAEDTLLYDNPAPSIRAKFAGIGALPGKAAVRIRADQMNGLYDQTGAVYVYSQNANATLTKQDIKVSYVQSGEQHWYEFQLVSTVPTELIMSGHELSLKPAYEVRTITLNKTSLAIVKGKTKTLKATVGPVTALNKNVKWTSSNTKIATVNASGKITAKRYGKVTITATSQDGTGVTAKCKVTVGYKIKYKLNGGKNNKSNPKAYYKTVITLQKPTREGYKFKGWYTDKRFKNRIKVIPKSYKRNLTLYAKWKKKK